MGERETAGLDLYEVGLEYELDVGSYKLQNCSRNAESFPAWNKAVSCHC
jgi:hypothetical protein